MSDVRFILTDQAGRPLDGIREAAGVSSVQMEACYQVILRPLEIEHLCRMWAEADPWEPMGALIRWQIAFTIEKKLNGVW